MALALLETLSGYATVPGAQLRRRGVPAGRKMTPDLARRDHRSLH